MLFAMRLTMWNRWTRSHATRRSLTLTCRGSKISRDELFAYTNGTFVTNERKACDRRYIKFDLDELCSIASRVGSTSAVREVEKMEGGFSKALLLKKSDGTEVVAKIPFKIAGPAHYTTAAEVAVLKYISQHTQVPVPKVLAWSSDPTNAVGSEYIIMEKAPGIQLVKIFDDMSTHDLTKLVKNLCALESELFVIKFPANGSLYLRESFRNSSDTTVPLDSSQDPEGQFCVGPSCDRTWHEEEICAVRKGPWSDLSTFGQAIVDREISRINQKSNAPFFGSREEQIAMIELAGDVMTRMSAESLPGKFARPTLWHSDLHPGNIFVSKEDPTRITSIIDWQTQGIQPLFCQARFPEFIDLPEDYEIGSPLPEPPQNLNEMDEDDRMLAEHEYKHKFLGTVYHLTSGLKNLQVHDALLMPSLFKDLFERCSEVSEEGVAPLRACLIEISKVWEDAGFAGKCPIEFTLEDLAKHEQEFEYYSNFHRVQAVARKYLNTDSEGWLAPGIDVEVKRQQNQELLQEVMQRSVEYGMSPDKVREIWPF